MTEEILTSLRRTNSENFGAGEGHPDLTDPSVKLDVASACDLTKDEAIKVKATSSRWSSLTKVFRLGVAAGPGADLPDISSSQAEQLPMYNKRGSLGKIFRHGFGHNVPTRGSDVNSSTALKDVALPQNKRGSLARLFKQSKPVDLEESCVKESEDCEEYAAKKETRKQQLGRIWKQKFGSDRRKPEPENILPNTEPLYGSGTVIPNPEQKRRSLGKMFRLKQNNSISEDVSHT